MLRLWPLWRAVGAVNSFESENIETRVAGIKVQNPVGLAAGFDKNCEILPALSSLGYGYVSCGTVTLEPRQGNPRTRLLRDEPREAVVNSMGFPNDGLDAAVERITRGQRWRNDTPIVASVSGTEIDDIVTCHRRLEPLVDAIEINISSPNTAGLQVFHHPDALSDLLTAINDRRSRPLFVKMPPFPEGQRDVELHDRVLSLAEVCVSAGVGALTVANTQPVSDARLGVGSGGLSGRPIYKQMLRMVSEVKCVVGDSTAVNACGGIFTAEDAGGALRAGADTVQLLTGMVYRGPCVAPEIAKGLSKLVSEEKLTSVRDLRTEANAAQLVRI
jgi:dihydroorotate dehydrogenase